MQQFYKLIHRMRIIMRRACGWAILLCLIGLFGIAACTSETPTTENATPQQVEPKPQSTPPDSTIAAPPTPNDVGILAAHMPDLATAPPALVARVAQFAEVLTHEPPILLLSADQLTEAAHQAQQLAIRQPDFMRFVYQGQAATPLRNEIMGVRPALPSDLAQLTDTPCTLERCYRVEMYNYAYNLTTVALVDVEAERDNAVLLDLMLLPSTQPDIPDHLADLAIDIAVNAPEVAEALGFAPGTDEATMPNIKTALNDSRCERSQHLCVAPTFVVDDRALWAIVDLTDLRLVGVRWTDLGTTSAVPALTEESLQNEVVSERYCERSTLLERNGWSLEYMLTSSDGLRIGEVHFQGAPVMRSAKLVDWHVSYSQTDGFGYSDAVGCPIFSSAAVIAYNGPYIEEIKDSADLIGFALIQDFMGDGWPQPCHYRYEQRYEFYNDGRFRVGGANLGRGCGTDGTYRPVVRIDLTAGGDGTADRFAEWTDDGWSAWAQEQWQLQTPQTAYSPDGYQYRVMGADGAGFYIEPGNGQFGDGGRGDNAYVYVTKRHADRDEGDADLVTIGACCNTDHQQGPEAFMLPAEPIAQSDLVIWYVAQLANDDTPGSEYCWADAVIEDGMVKNIAYPCAFGPLFVPIR